MFGAEAAGWYKKTNFHFPQNKVNKSCLKLKNQEKKTPGWVCMEVHRKYLRQEHGKFKARLGKLARLKIKSEGDKQKTRIGDVAQVVESPRVQSPRPQINMLFGIMEIDVGRNYRKESKKLSLKNKNHMWRRWDKRPLHFLFCLFACFCIFFLFLFLSFAVRG